MEIRWLAQDSVKISNGKNSVLACNPYSTLPTVQDATVVLLSREDNTLYHSPKEHVYTVDWPGEYEISDTLITGVELEEEGLLLNTAYNIHNSEDISVTLLGSLTHTLSGKAIEELGSTDILLLDIEHLDAKDAHKIVDNIEPKFTIPLYTNTEKLEAFLKISGVTQAPEAKELLKITKADIPVEGHSIILLQKTA